MKVKMIALLVPAPISTALLLLPCRLLVETIEAVADKGYESRDDIYECLINGTLPNVGLKFDKDERVYNLKYEEVSNIEELKISTKREDIEKCFHAGMLPECYVNTSVSVEVQELSVISCFIRNDDGTVTCPMGSILTQLKRKGQNTIYANKDACRQCKNRCTDSSAHKTVSFGPDATHVAVIMYGNPKYSVNKLPDGFVCNNSFYRKNRQKKKVVIRIREDKEKQHLRMCLSEHPFGTVKWYHGAHYVLCRGIEMATGELGLSFLAYNLRRAITLVGVRTLIEAARESTIRGTSLLSFRILLRKPKLSDIKGFC